MKGFKTLKKIYGNFKVTKKNIWIKEEKVKVWVCDDPFLN